MHIACCCIHSCNAGMYASELWNFKFGRENLISFKIKIDFTKFMQTLLNAPSIHNHLQFDLIWTLSSHLVREIILLNEEWMAIKCIWRVAKELISVGPVISHVGRLEECAPVENCRAAAPKRLDATGWLGRFWKFHILKFYCLKHVGDVCFFRKSRSKNPLNQSKVESAYFHWQYFQDCDQPTFFVRKVCHK